MKDKVTKVESNRVNKNLHQIFGIWWIQREGDKYYINQSDQTSQMFGHSDFLEKREIFSVQWDKTADSIIEKFPEYKKYIHEIKENFKKLINGEWTYYTHLFPWLDHDNEIIWIENQLMVVLKDDKGPSLIAGSSVDKTEQMNISDSLSKLEEANLQLQIANDRAIDLAEFLVWQIDYKIHPKGDLFLANQRYVDTFGFTRNKDGYLVLEDFMHSAYPDQEGEESLARLLNYFFESVNNKRDDFYRVLVKHRNVKTGEPLYLEHNTKVEKRATDGSLLEIGGYITDMTERVKMERQNQLLSKENERLFRSHSLAVKSGKVIIWYIDSREMEEGYFYGNDLLIDRLGLTRKSNGLFSKEDFHSTICQDDDESIELANIYFELNKKTSVGLDSFEKIIVKQQNPITHEIIYLEHNFEVEQRYPNGDLMIRGGFLNDVTREVEYRKRSEYLMKYDEMTNLRNRNSFEQYITSDELPQRYSLIAIDIDGLKFINDAFGHLKGDKAIKFTAKQLDEHFGESSIIFRIGGDEYAVISTLMDYKTIEQKIIELKDSLSVFYDKHNISINLSCGFEIVDGDIDFTEAFIEAENLMYRRKLDERSSRKSRTMEAVLETLNQKTEETKAHCQRMGNYAVKLMKKIGYSRTSDLEDMRLLCKVHDIGKITVSENLLSKDGKLTKEEYTRIKNHSEAGYKIVRNIVDSDEIAFGVLYHHERIDGRGYPFGLFGDDIPLYAKIISICDAFDVMVSGRAYSNAKPIDEVINELLRCAGTQFDEILVHAFIEILEEEKGR
jgi:diguanylate cyclase (GGDEF)-like protein